MNIKTESILSCIVVVIGLLLFTTLLCQKYIGEGSYVILICVLALSSIALNGFNRVREFDLKNLKLTLCEIKQVRDDIYAKATTLQTLAENLAEIATLLGTDRLPMLFAFQPGLQEAIYEKESCRFKLKENIIAILRSAGCDQARITTIENMFNDKIRTSLNKMLIQWLYGYADAVLAKRRQECQCDLNGILKRGTKQTDPEYQECYKRLQETDKMCKQLSDEISEDRLRQVFRESAADVSALGDYVKGKGVWSSEIECHLNKFKEFIRNHPVDLNPS